MTWRRRRLFFVRRQRQSGRDAAQDLAQVLLGPHWHCGPQAQMACATGCAAGCWQPQRQPSLEQAVQLQGICLVSFMMSFLGLHR
jgi:hypothetical protein